MIGWVVEAVKRRAAELASAQFAGGDGVGGPTATRRQAILRTGVLQREPRLRQQEPSLRKFVLVLKQLKGRDESKSRALARRGVFALGQ